MNRLVILGLAMSAALAADWPHSGLDLARSRTSGETVGAIWTQDWSFNSGFPTLTSPAARDGIVAHADVHGTLYALDADTGVPMWSHDAIGPIRTSPLLEPGIVVLGDEGFHLRGLDAATGALLWEQILGGSIMASPAGDGLTVFTAVGLGGEDARAFDLDTGAPAWSTPLGHPVFSAPALADGRVYTSNTYGDLVEIDAATGAVNWTYDLPGTVRFSSPRVVTPHLFIATTDPQCELVRVHTDPAQWATNWSTGALSDPLNPGGTELDACSSPVTAGGLVLLVVRFDHEVAGGNYQCLEYLFAFDAATGAAAAAPFPLLLGTRAGTNQNTYPQSRFCPTPAVVDTPSGPAAIVASSLSPDVRLVRVADGAVLTTVTLDAETFSSPIVANARIYLATLEGTLYCYTHDANDAPFAPALLSPISDAAVYTDDFTLDWADAADANDAPATLAYIVRADDDGEVLRDWDYEASTAAAVTAATFTAPTSGDIQITWSVRAQDPDGAWSDWSAEETFWVINNPAAPAPPSNLSASPGDAQVTLSWTASPSPDVVAYEVAVQEGANPWGPYTNVGLVTTTTVTGLTNGVLHTFRVRALDAEGLTSTYTEASATPQYAVTLNGSPAPNLATAAALAMPGDTIQLGYGTFPQAATVGLREGVSLYGQSPHQTIVTGNGVDPVLSLIAGAPPRGTIGRLTIAGGLIGVDTAGFTVVLEYAVIRDNDTGVRIAAGSDALVKNCTLYNSASYGVFNESTLAAVRNTIVDSNGIGLHNEPAAAMAATYNDVVGNLVADYSGVTPGTGAFSAVPLYDDAAAGDFRELPGSLTIDMGDPADDFSQEPAPNGGRINVGAYGNTSDAAEGAITPGGGGGSGGGGGGGPAACFAGAGASAAAWALLLLFAALGLRRSYNA